MKPPSATLTLMPEIGIDVPLWWRPDGIENVTLDEIRQLGVSEKLIARLLDWQAEWEEPTKTSRSMSEVALGGLLSVRLAWQLQEELPDMRIYLMYEGAPRPIDSWTKDGRRRRPLR